MTQILFLSFSSTTEAEVITGANHKNGNNNCNNNCKDKFLENSRMLSHADMYTRTFYCHAMELSGKFC